MSRQSITLTDKNDAWLRYQVEETGEYNTKSELINDLVRRARRVEEINKKLEASETSGLVEQSSEDMLKEFKYRIKR
ncbi:CopG family transcriptional regulator [Idiomarina sp.]|uniref:ribbon-helix-helix domain-containing protein n=2 Tax=Idiomarina sp. TaxID=1874361 RepID=UPI0025C4B7E0|nr:CopG family transcriptional regulator [Idiomarina sp.]